MRRAAIDAIVFDLDGTLVQTEKLKAEAYAAAAAELRPEVDRTEVARAFGELAGRTREEVSKTLLRRFALEEAAAARTPEFGVDEPWRAFTRLRLRIYEDRIADPAVLREHRWPHTIALLELARAACEKLGLATSSHRPQVAHVLGALDLLDAFDAVATADDIQRGKPDPEIYLLVAELLAARPGHSLVLEDSPAGVRAAIAAGMRVVALATPFTRAGLYELDALDPRWIVDDPGELLPVVGAAVSELRA